MLSTKPVLPNFLKTLVITSMAFGSVAAFAGDDKKAEEIGDLKDLKGKHAQKADEMAEKVDAEVLSSSLTDEAKEAMEKGEEMIDKVKEIQPGE